MMTMRRLRCGVLALVTIAAGIMVRFAPLHLPPFWYKYGGSILWAIMLYWLVAATSGVRRIAILAAIAFTLSVAVELFKLVPGAALDAFRVTLPGKLLLGRFFSPGDLVAYAVGITLVAMLDACLSPRSWPASASTTSTHLIPAPDQSHSPEHGTRKKEIRPQDQDASEPPPSSYSPADPP